MGLISATHRLTVFLLLFVLLCATAASSLAEKKIIIASNGAGKKFIEHTLPAITFAACKDIDYVELHVVMTADDQLIVFRDLTLDRLTDAMDLFPGRSREDGSYYVIDFALDEIRQMRLTNDKASDADARQLSLAIPTLKEELALIRRLESILAKPIGISLEIRDPRFHSDAGKDISSASLDILKNNNYVDDSSKIFIQCFDPDELRRIHGRLMPEKGMQLPLIQLTGNNDKNALQQENFEQVADNGWLYSYSGLKIISSYAAAVGLPAARVMGKDGSLLLADYIAAGHKYGLSVFVYSLNSRPEDLPPFAESFPSLIDFYLRKADIDGFYTDDFSEALKLVNNADTDASEKPDLSGPAPPLELLPKAEQDITGNGNANQEMNAF